MDKSTKSITLLGMFQDDVMGAQAEHAHLVEQMEHDPAGYWRTMPGAIQVGDQWSASNGAIIGMIWFQPRPNQRFLVFEEVTGENTSRLAWLRWPDGVITTICTRARVPGRPASSQFLQSGAWLYHINGIERPIRWDGDRVVPVGFSGSIGAPLVSGGSQGATIVDIAGAELDPTPDLVKSWQRGLGELPTTGTARWVVAYGTTEVNDLGQESYMSPLAFASGDNDTANGRQAVRIASPTRDSHIHAVNLWRTINIEGGSVDLPVMYLVARFPFGGAFDYVDMAPDSDLGPDVYVPEAVGPMPIGIRCAAFHHDSMWVAVGQQLYRSAPRQAEVFPAGSRYDVGSAGSGHIVALFSVPRGLVVACTKGVFMAKGNPVDGYRVETVSEQAECAGPRSFAYIDGLGLVLLTVNGPAVLQGTLDDDTTTKLIPLRGIRKVWRWLVSPIGLHNALVIHRPDVEEVWFHVPRLGENRPSLGFVYHYGGNGNLGWSLRPNWRFTSATVYQQRVWLGSWDSGDDDTAGIHLLGRGSVAFAAVTGPNEPPDPAEPISPTYDTEPWAIAATGSRWFQRDITGTPVVGTYETGVVVADRRVAPHAVEFVGIATGIDPGADIQVRYDRRVQYVSTNDEAWVADIHSEQPDLDTDGQKRPKWGVSTWDDAGMWVEYEPASIRRPVPGEAHTEFQFRIRGADLRIAGLRVALVEGNKRTREVT